MLYDYFDKERFSDVDLIISAGDLRPKFLSFLVSMLNKPCYYVRGNHDIIYEQQPPLGCKNIDGKVVTYKGVRIVGFEGCRWYGGRGVEYTERQMAFKVAKVKLKIWTKGGIDIVVAHAPPKGIHDGKDLCHVGFCSFLKLIEKYKPQYFIHGHTHPNYGYTRGIMTEFKETKVVNVYGYYVFEVKPKKATNSRGVMQK